MILLGVVRYKCVLMLYSDSAVAVVHLLLFKCSLCSQLIVCCAHPAFGLDMPSLNG